MASKGMGAFVRNDGNQEQLRPVANPVNTYSSPDQSGLVESQFKAKLVEHQLESMAAPIEREFKQQVEADREVKTKQQKVEAVMSAHGEFFPWWNSQSESFESVPDNEYGTKVQEAFTRQFEKVTDPMKRFALTSLMEDTIQARFVKRQREAAAAAEEKKYGDFAITVAATTKNLKERGATPEEIDSELEALFKMNKGRLDPKEMVKRMLSVQETGLEEAQAKNVPRDKWDTTILEHLDRRKLLATENPEYNASRDRIRSKLNSLTPQEVETKQIEFDRYMEDQIKKGVSAKTIDQLFQKAWDEGGSKYLNNSSRRYLLSQVEARDRKYAAAASKQAAYNAAVATVLNTGVVPVDKVPYTTENGETRYLSQNEIERQVADYGVKRYLSGDKPNVEAFYANVATKVRVPQIAEKMEAGIAAMGMVTTDPNKIEVKTDDGKKITTTRSMQLLKSGFAEYQRIRDAGGEYAVAIQLPNEAMRNKYEAMYTLSKLGYSVDHIATTLASRGDTKVTVDHKRVESSVKSVLNRNNINPLTWFENDATNAGYVRKYISEGTEQLMRLSGLDQATAQAEVVRRFTESHKVSPKGHAYVHTGNPAVRGLFNSEENYLNALDDFAVAWKADIVKRGKDQGVDLSKTQMSLTTHPYRHGYFLMQTTDGTKVSEVFGGEAYAVDARTISKWYWDTQAAKNNAKRK